ncbi:MAG: putative stage sporulation family protein [Holophagaceae bacterium]|nr:putative stage sporulation family protein [Holophagaceae bacterium]
MHKGLVLVVDDEAPIRDILSFYLKRAGYQVLLAENGRQALEEMAKLQPDLIISDLRMPEIAGDEFCQIVKGDPATRDIYFVLVSAMDGSASRIGGLNLGADDMIAKPFHAQEVMAKVASAFRIIQMQKEIKRQNQILTRFQERMTAELSLAAKLQMGLLPEAPGEVSCLRYYHRYLPAEGIGGDIYAISTALDGGVAIMIADVSGHGVTAALISAMVKTSFSNQIQLSSNPREWAEGMNLDLVNNTLEEQFATAFLGHFDPEANLLRYVVAGHEPPFRIPVGAAPEALKGKGFMLGIDASLPFMELSAPFEPGDRIILYTDGLVEVEREDREYLGNDGLMSYCAQLPSDGEAAVEQLLEQARAFHSPNPFVDDVTLVLLDRAR